ncbi:MAG: 4Fe-4S dicluster domain-containing protein [Fibrobacter sp.]|nr:4Fe-4S dicluster domain-containing protein [Fibrobacter sp.]
MIKTAADVVSWRMCVGCGACEYICENRNISLHNITEQGIRPVLGDNCIGCGKCTSVCPGLNNTKHTAGVNHAIAELIPHCGFAVEVWEGYANDKFLRN